MAGGSLYLLIIMLCVVAGLLFVRVVIPKMGQRQSSRRIQQGIAEYLASKEAEQKKTISKTHPV
jgi:hypothetical protein